MMKVYQDSVILKRTDVRTQMKQSKRGKNKVTKRFRNGMGGSNTQLNFFFSFGCEPSL